MPCLFEFFLYHVVYQLVEVCGCLLQGAVAAGREEIAGGYAATVAAEVTASCACNSLTGALIQEAKDECTVGTLVAHHLLCALSSFHTVAPSLFRLQSAGWLIIACGSCPSFIQQRDGTTEDAAIDGSFYGLASLTRVAVLELDAVHDGLACLHEHLADDLLQSLFHVWVAGEHLLQLLSLFHQPVNLELSAYVCHCNNMITITAHKRCVGLPPANNWGRRRKKKEATAVASN